MDKGQISIRVFDLQSISHPSEFGLTTLKLNEPKRLDYNISKSIQLPDLHTQMWLNRRAKKKHTKFYLNM